ncbi:MAG TPA: hypothetical protein VF334_21965 [Polyangia bacterium]
MRALIAAVLAALSLILVVLCWRGILPGLAVVAPMTLAFVGACVGVLGATEETSVGRRRFAVGATIAATLVLIVACAMMLRALGGT